MLSKNESKLIKSLQFKKYRDAEGLFVAEGLKTCEELLKSDFKIKWVITTKHFLEENKNIFKKIPERQLKLVGNNELQSLSHFLTNNTLIIIAETKPNIPISTNGNEIIFVLDQIRDPGNLGTILRIADWYGIEKIICSSDSVDFYNPKVIAASMGSFTRLQIYYTYLPNYFQTLKKPIPILGAFLDGENIHSFSFSFPSSGFLIMGNESNGIQSALLPFITQRVTIPRFGKAESLNVAISTGIIIDNWKKSQQ